ncbi:MAG: hypothetical protein NC204_04340 [Candidatus Amulumruptor caecigallinarius]|nr:hypothetical protein [Candidatus Amulumruptor caecigallinarius]
MKTLTYILMLVAGALLTACSGEERQPDAPPATDDVCELVFTLNTGTPSAQSQQTRADGVWGDDPSPEPGIDIENVLDNVSLYLVTPGGNCPLTLVGQDISEGKYEYKVKVALGVVNAVPAGMNQYRISGRLVAVVNHTADFEFSNPFNTDAMDIADIQKKLYIPMWGVKTLSGVLVASNTTMHIGEVKLLRALPKITVKIDDDLKNEYKITAIREDRQVFRRYALCTPKGAETAASTEALLREGCFNPVAEVATSPLKFKGVGTSETWCYLPETPLATTGGVPESLTVTLERRDGTAAPFTGKVYLCDYEGGNPKFDTAFPGLVRNHDYQYRISLRELQFVVSARQWIYGGKVHLDME